MHKNDLRIVKTKTAIRTAFVELLSEKSFEEITVKDILEKAVINRTTFYRHYTDKYDLAQKVSDELLQNYIRLTDARFHETHSFESLMKILDQVYFSMEKDREIVLLFLKSGSFNFRIRLQHMLQHSFATFAGKQDNATGNLELQSLLFSNIAMTLIEYALSHPEYQTASELIKELKNYAAFITSAQITDENSNTVENHTIYSPTQKS